MNEMKNRGLEDVLIAVVDGLKGFPEAITAFVGRSFHWKARIFLLTSRDYRSDLYRPSHPPQSRFRLLQGQKSGSGSDEGDLPRRG